MKKVFILCSAVLMGISCGLEGGSLSPELALVITIPAMAGAAVSFIKSDLYE